jgi:ferredoxin--NADP+ reductase
MSNEKFNVETITSIHAWTPKLFSFRTTRNPGFRFTAGQFARLGVPVDGGVVWRAYSMASAPSDEYLEFFSIVVPGGEFTSQLSCLRVGDTLLVDKTAFGYLTLDRFQPARDLWLLATGTGLAPFLSILHGFEVWQQYQNIVLVYSARLASELAYHEHIFALKQHPYFGEFAARQLRYVPVVTREPMAGALSLRITELLVNGQLEQHTGLTLSPSDSRLMICGNPEMVTDTRKILQTRGLSLARLSAPGQIAVEQFW